MWFFNIFGTGLKRLISSALSLVASAIQSEPTLAPLAILLEQLAGIFGVVGVSTAAVKGTAVSTKKYIFYTLSGILGLLSALSTVVPALFPFHDQIVKWAAIVSAMAVGAKVTDTQVIHVVPVKTLTGLQADESIKASCCKRE